MQNEINLGRRLQVVADFVEPGHMVVDVGTDHGYLPVYLVQKNIASIVYASDVAEKPLASARETIKKYGLSSSIELILSDGLCEINPVFVDTIVIAGMGGHTICEIIEAAPWTRAYDIHFVLQPMSHARDLRTYLYKNGFYIKKECPVCENGKVYSVMSVGYDTAMESITEVFSYIGMTPFYESSERELYLRHILNVLAEKKAGLEKAKDETVKKELRKLRRTMTSIKQILKGIETNVHDK